MTKISLLIGIVCLLLAACTNNRYCLKPQRYDNSRSIPALQSADGLSVPRAPGALLVLSPPASDRVPFGHEVKGADGKTEIQCLDQPPPIPKPQGNIITE